MMFVSLPFIIIRITKHNKYTAPSSLASRAYPTHSRFPKIK